MLYNKNSIKKKSLFHIPNAFLAVKLATKRMQPFREHETNESARKFSKTTILYMSGEQPTKTYTLEKVSKVNASCKEKEFSTKCFCLLFE